MSAFFYNKISDYIITTYAELEELEASGDQIGDFSTKQSKILEKYNITSERFLARKIWLHKFTLMLLQRRICSSAYAADHTLGKMIQSREVQEFDLENLSLLHEMKQLTLGSHIFNINKTRAVENRPRSITQ